MLGSNSSPRPTRPLLPARACRIFDFPIEVHRLLGFNVPLYERDELQCQIGLVESFFNTLPVSYNGNLGFLNIYIALTIATCKALIVVLYFMHVRYSPRLTWIFAGAGIFWLMIMFVLMISDYATR